MAEYEKRKRSRERPTSADAEPVSEGEGQQSAVSEETEDLLDEIDSVLEENAETFVREYRQKGGQ